MFGLSASLNRPRRVLCEFKNRRNIKFVISVTICIFLLLALITQEHRVAFVVGVAIAAACLFASAYSGKWVFFGFSFAIIGLPALLNAYFLSNLNQFQRYGYNAIRNYSGSFGEVSTSFIQIALFVVLVFFLSRVAYPILERVPFLFCRSSRFLKSRNYLMSMFRSINSLLKRQLLGTVERSTKPNSGYFWPVMFLVVLLGQSILMYEYAIGIPGIQPVPLPGRVIGFLYYSRLLIFPLVLYVVIRKCRNQALATFIACACILIVAVSSSSRILVLVFVVASLFALTGHAKRWHWVVVALTGAVSLNLATATRNIVYMADGRGGLKFNEVANLYGVITSFIDYSMNSPVTQIYTLLTRIGNPQSIALASKFEALQGLNTFDIARMAIYGPSATMDMALWHSSWMGINVPIGTIDFPTLAGVVVILSNNNLWGLFILAIFLGGIVAALEYGAGILETTRPAKKTIVIAAGVALGAAAATLSGTLVLMILVVTLLGLRVISDISTIEAAQNEPIS